MPLETPSDGLDLSAMQRAGAAVDAAAARIRAEGIRERLAPDLAALPLTVRQAFEGLVDEIGRISAEAEAARQAATEARRERGDWLRIDPLRHMPEDRGATPPPPPSSIEIHAADADFVGFGWHSAEGRGRESWRWSGLSPVASIVVPDLGPGTVALAFDIELPFRHAFGPNSLTILANGEPLELTASLREAHRGTFSALWEGAEVPGANLGLVLVGPLVRDPAGRDSRQLGLAIRSVKARRLDSAAG